jgi:hypothetical protein
VNSNVCSKKKVMNANKKSNQSILHFLPGEAQADPAIERWDLSKRDIER